MTSATSMGPKPNYKCANGKFYLHFNMDLLHSHAHTLRIASINDDVLLLLPSLDLMLSHLIAQFEGSF